MDNKEETYQMRILEIMERFANGNASEADKRELDDWYAGAPSLKKYADGLTSSEKLQAKDRLLHNINKQIYREAVPIKQLRTNIFRRIVLAAVILIIITGLFYYSQIEHFTPTEQQAHSQTIIPGGNKAFLTLADGTRISLTDATNGDIAKQAGVTISKTTDGQLIYTAHNTVEQSDTYNTIETPNGGQYQLLLPDGTTVWLNASSSLKYPTNFAIKGQRRVELTGEAYFEVAKDKKRPFIVTTNNISEKLKEQEVEVLGTHFNINAYNDDNTIKTTLLEGSVRVKSSPSLVIILNPGQQSINNGNDLKIADVNTEYAVAWKDGYFRFNDKTLEMAMKEISRWYNVNVSYKNKALKNEPLAGTISKYSSIGQVLKKMELTGAFHFTVKAREIMVE